jgi:hypothetical protein
LKRPASVVRKLDARAVMLRGLLGNEYRSAISGFLDTDGRTIRILEHRLLHLPGKFSKYRVLAQAQRGRLSATGLPQDDQARLPDRAMSEPECRGKRELNRDHADLVGGAFLMGGVERSGLLPGGPW